MSCACETQERELRTLRDRLHMSTKANTTYRARIRELEDHNDTVRTVRDACTRARTENAELRDRLHMSTKANTEHRARIREEESHNKSLRQTVKALEEIQRNLNAARNDGYAENNRLHARVKELEGFVCTACKDVAADNEHLMKINKEVAKENTRLRDEPTATGNASEVKDLRAQLAVCEDINRRLRERVEELEETEGCWRDGAKRASAENVRMAKRVKELKVQRNRLRARVKELGGRCNELGSAIVEILAHPVPSTGLHNALSAARKLLALETPPLKEESAVTSDVPYGPYTADDTNTWRKG